jgi:hypothetical protein
MSEYPPRLDVADAGLQPGYAPISWTAVSSLAVAIVFVVVLGVASLYAVYSSEPLLDERLFLFPILALVLAFVARRQIEASEGTRTGLVYANAAWWISVIVGLGYAGYLLANQFTIRSDAEKHFQLWSETVKKIDRSDPNNRAIYESCYLTLPPAVRAQVPSPSNREAMEQVFASELEKFQQLDVVRIVSRNPGAAEFVAQGMRDWQEQPRKITCTLAYRLVTPEGEFGLLVPMEAAVDGGRREWQVVPAPGGFIRTRKLSEYGWLLQRIEDSGQQFAREFLAFISAGPEQRKVAIEGYIHPEGHPEVARSWIEYDSVLARLAVAGTLAVMLADSLGSDALVNRPDFLTNRKGQELSAEQRARFFAAFQSGRVVPAGTGIRENAELLPILKLAPDQVTLEIPAEVSLPGSASFAHARLILATRDSQLIQKIQQLRENTGPLSPTIPLELQRLNPRWRLLRLESDLNPVKIPNSPFSEGT